MDLEADCPVPIRYLINIPERKKDVWIKITNKIEAMAFRRAILAFVKARSNDEDPSFSNGHISVTPKKTFRERQEENATGGSSGFA